MIGPFFILIIFQLFYQRLFFQLRFVFRGSEDLVRYVAEGGELWDIAP